MWAAIGANPKVTSPGPATPEDRSGGPLVSVVIPTRDRPAFLREAIASVLGQTYRNLEIVIVDDGSNPAIPGGVSDRRVRVLRNERPLGVARARNVGLAAARGDYVAFMDDDDQWADCKIASQIASFVESTAAAWSACGAIIIDARGAMIGAQRLESGRDVASTILAGNVIPGGGSGVLAEVAAVRALGGFDERFSVFADWDMWIRLAQHSPMTVVDRPLVAYLRHDGGMSQSSREAIGELRRLGMKHAGLAKLLGVQWRPTATRRWLGEMNLRAGRRWTAGWLYFQVAIDRRSPRHLVGVARVVATPRLFLRSSERRSPPIPAVWRADLASIWPSLAQRGRAA